MFGVRLTCLCYKPTSRHLLSLSSMFMDGDVPFIHVQSMPITTKTCEFESRSWRGVLDTSFKN